MFDRAHYRIDGTAKGANRPKPDREYDRAARSILACGAEIDEPARRDDVKTILVVDDEPEIVLLLRDYLEDAGFGG